MELTHSTTYDIEIYIYQASELGDWGAEPPKGADTNILGTRMVLVVGGKYV